MGSGSAIDNCTWCRSILRTSRWSTCWERASRRICESVRLFGAHPGLARRPWCELRAYQERALATLRQLASQHSPFYREFHRNREPASLEELPVLTKGVMMDHFDEFVTDPSIHL